jgi:aryl-alcohol dehydrogenase-like predicted oxidoreductase
MGRCGLNLSVLSLSAWLTFGNPLDAHKASELSHQADDAGINMIDNADIYTHGMEEKGVEKLTPEALDPIEA